MNHLAENLRLLCGFYPSVAEICRRIGINRQQFNKYLSGASQPSVRSLRRICDFFGVDETEILLPFSEFSAIARARDQHGQGPSALAATIEAIVAQHPDSQQKLQKYCGYYAGFLRSPDYPGMILRNCTVIFQDADHTYVKTIERVSESDPLRPGDFVSKYLGLVLHGDDRIYILDQNSQSHQAFALTVLYPTHRNSLHLLSGLSLSVSGGPARQVFASRCVLEYHGRSVNRRDAIAACGVYPADSGKISEAIRLRTRTEVGGEEGALLAFEG